MDRQAKDWLWLIKLFELELSSRKIATQLGLSYPTVVKGVNIIRMAIMAHNKAEEGLLCGEIEMDEAYFGGEVFCQG